MALQGTGFIFQAQVIVCKLAGLLHFRALQYFKRK
jgi:hypothetical protein